MLEAEVNDERTILDYLNEDCWRAVLQYVPVQDLIRTERASRGWQEVVLTYLQGVRIIIEEEDWKKKKSHPNTCTLKPSQYKLFNIWCNKLGSSVASIYCNTLENLEIIKENCPNLGALQLAHVGIFKPEQLTQHRLHDSFKFLQRLSFYMCSITDDSVSQFIGDRALEKLEFRHCSRLTGLFFDSINITNLKSLALEVCDNMQSKYLLPAVDRLGELTELKLRNSSNSWLTANEDMQLVLDKMPKLERVELSSGRMSDSLSERLSRLTRLKHLSVSYQLTNGDLETVTRCCKELRTLELLDCSSMTPGFIKLICRLAGARLTSLKLDQFNEARDDDVVDLVRGCVELKSLTVAGAEQLTCELPARAAAARHEARPGRLLRLDLSYTNLSDEFYLQDRGLERYGQYKEMKTKYEDLIVVLENTIDEYDDEDSYDEDYDIYDQDDFDYNYYSSYDDEYQDYEEEIDDEQDSS